jgi:hypothetical protein
MSIYNKSFELVRCAYIHMMYDAFLFYVHVVADVDEFSVPSFSQSHLMVFFSRSLLCHVWYWECLEFFRFPVMYCTALTLESPEVQSWCSLWSLNHLVNFCIVLYCTVLYCAVLGVNRLYLFVYISHNMCIK